MTHEKLKAEVHALVATRWLKEGDPEDEAMFLRVWDAFGEGIAETVAQATTPWRRAALAGILADAMDRTLWDIGYGT